MKCFSLGVLGALLLGLLAALLVPQYGNYTTRAQASDWLALVRPMQDQIEARAIQQQSLQGVGTQTAAPAFHPERKPAHFEVRASGEILIAGAQVMLLLTPTLHTASASAAAQAAAVSWRCVGAPLDNVPWPCRGATPKSVSPFNAAGNSAGSAPSSAPSSAPNSAPATLPAKAAP